MYSAHMPQSLPRWHSSVSGSPLRNANLPELSFRKKTDRMPLKSFMFSSANPFGESVLKEALDAILKFRREAERGGGLL